MRASRPPPSVALVRAGAGGVSARRTTASANVAVATRLRRLDRLDRTSIVTTHAPDARGSHDSTPIAIPRVRRKRQRLGPNGSIESDPAVNVRARRVRPRAGSLPISCLWWVNVRDEGPCVHRHWAGRSDYRTERGRSGALRARAETIAHRAQPSLESRPSSVWRAESTHAPLFSS